jgi:uncharacterized protein (TIGR03437 family)
MNKTSIGSRHFLALILTGIVSAMVLWKGFPAHSALLTTASPVNDIARAETVFNTDFVSAGFGGMRTVGTGTIKLAGVSGQVTQALLFWHGPTNSASADANATVMFNGANITATNIGFSQSNCWPFTNSQAYRADVTSQVKGNGNYSLGNFRKSNAEINGVSLIVFFNDGNPENNRDVVIFNGNDSNAPNSFDANGWTAALPGINYSGGNASIQLHVSDGQSFLDDGLSINGKSLVGSGANFSGGTVPLGEGCCGFPEGGGTGGLWDIVNYNLVPFLSLGTNSVTLTTGFRDDCLSLIVALIDLPAGAAPPPADADLAVSVTASPNPVSGNNNLSYTVTVRNNGGLAANAPVLSGSLAPQTSFLSLAAPAGWNCAVPQVGSAGSISCNAPSLAAGATASFTLTALVACTVTDGAAISQTFAIQSANDPVPNNNSATASVTALGVSSQIRINKTSLEFSPVAAMREVGNNAPFDTFTIENAGCAPLSIRLQRIGADVTSGRIVDADDSSIFTLLRVNPNGSETPLSISPGAPPVLLAGGETQVFKLRFHPLIPILSGKTSELFANQAIPDVITSQLLITPEGNAPKVINVTARVATPVQLIHPTDSRLSPLIVFTRSATDFTVECSVHDPNLDLYLARYQFFDQGERPVGLPADLNLTQPIAQRGLVRGQSFTIIQRFAGVLQSNIAKVQVTLFDREINVVSARVSLGTSEPVLANVSAASYLATGLASESMAAAFGANLSSNVQTAGTLPLPSVLNGTSVRVRDGGGVERLAPLFFVSPGQINYQIPPGTRVGAATVSVQRNDQTVAREVVQIAASAPALFSANASGQGVASGVALRVAVNGGQKYESLSRFDQGRNQFVPLPLSFSQTNEDLYLILFGAGLRFRNPQGQVTAKVGGVDAQVLYAGAQGGFVGLDQVNLWLPRSLAGRGEVDVVLTIDGKPSNPVRVSFGGSGGSLTGSDANTVRLTRIQSAEDADHVPILRLPTITLPVADRNRNQKENR